MGVWLGIGEAVGVSVVVSLGIGVSVASRVAVTLDIGIGEGVVLDIVVAVGSDVPVGLDVAGVTFSPPMHPTSSSGITMIIRILIVFIITLLIRYQK